MWTISVGTSAKSVGGEDASAFSAATVSASSMLFSGAVGGGKTIVLVRFNASGAVAGGKTIVLARFNASGAVGCGKTILAVWLCTSGTVAGGNISVAAQFCTSAKGGKASVMAGAQIGAVAGVTTSTDILGGASARVTEMFNRC